MPPKKVRIITRWDLWYKCRGDRRSSACIKFYPRTQEVQIVGRGFISNVIKLRKEPSSEMGLALFFAKKERNFQKKA